MPLPLWWGHVGKRIFNPLELKRGKRPALTHVGRSSGKVEALRVHHELEQTLADVGLVPTGGFDDLARCCP